MEGPHGVPVEEARQAVRFEIRADGETGFAIRGFGNKFEPGFAGQFHFGAQSQEAIRFDRLDTPKIKRLAGADLVGVTAAGGLWGTGALWDLVTLPRSVRRYNREHALVIAPTTNGVAR